MKKLTFVAPCILGLEGICVNDFKYNGIPSPRAENGRVVFEGDLNILARANLISRYSERILLLLAEGEVLDFEQLFTTVNKIPWENYIGKTDAFPVQGRCLGSRLHSVSDCQKIIKKAVVDRLSSKYGIRWFEESGAVHKIRFLIMNDRVSVMLDTSGEGLHKRGYRADANDAPIKETLAAAMTELAGVRANHFVVDPMCGSGTIPIEAALKATKTAPGLNRTFAAEKWAQIPPTVWSEERERARSLVNSNCSFRAIGYDIDESALEIARSNAEKAGVGDRITFIKRDIRDFVYDAEYETVICNPPYGERLLDLDEAEELYRIMGKKLVPSKGKTCAVITPDDDFEKLFGRRADKRRKLYNGTLKCQVYLFKGL